MQHAKTKHIGAILFLVLLLGASVAMADITVQAEAEEFIDSYNITGQEIMKSFCSGASEYYAVDGLDMTGEWIEVEIAVPTTGYYHPRVGYQVAFEDSASVRLTVLDDEGIEVNRVSDFDLLEGWGFGWGPFFVSVGDEEVWLKAGVNRFRIRHVWGTMARVDYVRFSYTGSPVENRTWGRIKSMYR